jgi:hypothetical protein
MWALQRKSTLPREWSEDLWTAIFGAGFFRLIVDRFHFKVETRATNRVLGEPGRDESEFCGSRSKSSIRREYFGRLGHLDTSNPASSMLVHLSWETMPQMVGAHEWWHWSSETVPREGVYGWVNPVQLGTYVTLDIVLGTDSSGEALFEQLYLRSRMSALNPVFIDGRIKTLANQDGRIGVISEYSIEQYME